MVPAVGEGHIVQRMWTRTFSWLSHVFLPFDILQEGLQGPPAPQSVVVSGTPLSRVFINRDHVPTIFGTPTVPRDHYGSCGQNLAPALGAGHTGQWYSVGGAFSLESTHASGYAVSDRRFRGVYCGGCFVPED